MQIEELYNVPISPLAISTFATKWSTDNHISILTERGVHIFELQPTPMSLNSTLKFSRTFIYPPEIFPGETFTLESRKEMWNARRDEIYSFLLEESLTPKASESSEMNPKIQSLFWSPQNLMHPNKCLLTIITSTGAILILYKIALNWYPVYDLSSISPNTKELNRADGETVSEFLNRNKHRAMEMQACCACWSNLIDGFAYLAVSYRNGLVAIFRICRIKTFSEIPPTEMAAKVKFEEGIISVLSWTTFGENEFLIIAGYNDGRICGYKIMEDFRVKTRECYYKFLDRIRVGSIEEMSRTDSEMRILVAKGSFFFLIRVNREGILQRMQQSQIKGHNISGIIRINDICALVTTVDTAIHLIMTDPKFEAIPLANSLTIPRTQFQGLTHSPSKVLYLLVTSPCNVYDHLVNREPSKLHFFTLTSSKTTKWEPLEVLGRSKGSLEDCWDCLEAIRVRGLRAQSPATSSPPLPLLSKDINDLTLHELRIAMWLSVIFQVSKRKTIISEIGSIAGEISDAQPFIFLKTACSHLERLLQKEKSMSTEEEGCIRSLRMYLEVYLAGEEDEETRVIRRIKYILGKMKGFGNKGVERCNLCGIVVDEVPWTATRCPNGHALPRCAITLLQITTLDYKTCPICGQIFHPCLEEEYGGTRCLYCDVPAITDCRVNLPPEEMSLSKPQKGFVFKEDETEEDTLEAAPLVSKVQGQ